MKSLNAPPLQVSWHGSVLELRLQRPDRRNALDDRLVDALSHALHVEASRARAIVLTGGDHYFCAGGDVTTMPTWEAGLFGPSARLSRLHDVLLNFRQCLAPSIAAVERYAIGAGWGLALACDVVIAGRGTQFSAPFADRGLAADAGVAWHLTRRLGRHGAARHLFAGEPLSAEQAAAAGLATLVCEDTKATEVAHDMAARLTAGPLESSAVTRWMAEVSESADYASFLREERVGVSLAGHGLDATEGRAAFSEHRHPVFAR